MSATEPDLVSRESDWRCSLRVPEGWITIDLDLGEAERRDALVASVEELLRETPALTPIAGRIAETADAAAQSAGETGGLFLALGFEHVGVDVVATAVTVYGIYGVQSQDVDSLAQELTSASPKPEDFGGREVNVVDLPVGPAVRVHTISSSSSAGGDQDSDAIVAGNEPELGDGTAADVGGSLFVEALDHVIPVPGRSDLVLLSCTTPAIALGEELLAVFDAVAASVEIEL